MVLKDLLTDKSEKLDKASEKERVAREQAVEEAEKEGKPLSVDAIMELRKQEELARLEESKKILKQKYGRE